jgi:hypothetical protein
MDLEYTPEQEKLRTEIRATLEQVMTPERTAAIDGRIEGGLAVRDCVRADAPLRGALESAYRFAVINTFGGGANEIQRDIIAMAGLGMPRAPRDLRAPDRSGGTPK